MQNSIVEIEMYIVSTGLGIIQEFGWSFFSDQAGPTLELKVQTHAAACQSKLAGLHVCMSACRFTMAFWIPFSKFCQSCMPMADHRNRADPMVSSTQLGCRRDHDPLLCTFTGAKCNRVHKRTVSIRLLLVKAFDYLLSSDFHLPRSTEVHLKAKQYS